MAKNAFKNTYSIYKNILYNCWCLFNAELYAYSSYVSAKVNIIIVMNRSDKQREMDELKKLHDSIEKGLPKVPTPLLEYARDKAKLEELRH